MSESEKISKLLLDIKAVSLNAEKPFKWVSGIFAPIYTDCRLIMSYPKERRIVIDSMAEVALKEIGADEVEVIAGVATSGIPYGAWLAEKLDKPMIYVRKEKKDHGKENLIEGKLESGQKTVLVEDLVSTAGTSISCVTAIRANNAVIENQLSIFTYQLKESETNFENAKITARSLTNFTTLVNVAAEIGYLKETEKDMVLEWKEDPKNWGKKHGFE